ncbi:MAG: YeeE/YedE family protein [Cyclobacteriaceae bacterium]|jgi:hypothetical protein|nr:YeeE/YedE family protein [Cyclobacteriaceae bacterium]
MKNHNQTDGEVSFAEQHQSSLTVQKSILFLLSGFFFGFILIKAEVFSWYRIQEMFRFQSFHMYGVIGSAVVTGIVSTYIINVLKGKKHTVPIHVTEKKFHKGIIPGSLIFGLGWGISGACPGPIFLQVGMGYAGSVLLLLAALVGTLLYGLLRDKLPH